MKAAEEEHGDGRRSEVGGADANRNAEGGRSFELRRKERGCRREKERSCNLGLWIGEKPTIATWGPVVRLLWRLAMSPTSSTCFPAGYANIVLRDTLLRFNIGGPICDL
ncbi:hypothetical protein L1887_11532 [Cichorium endivia]|nr:hypothetical protein L1887_11532 [Cichorium endivia]